MQMLGISILTLYGISLVLVFTYSLFQLGLSITYRKETIRKRKSGNSDAEIPDISKLPVVTVQLPVYNELYVVERLIRQVCRLDYPLDKLEIQVLDDSEDETADRAKAVCREERKKGVNVKYIRREERVGFKAGALDYGMKIAEGELIAIFDADFLPRPDFLLRTVPPFANKSVGVVQTRWGHINKNYSLLTKLQAFGLDAHFTIEQTGRNAGGHFINFNGTAGVWRKKTIEDAGGWQHDTLTEDLDLSYRAQLKGWKFKYLEEVESPAELPVTISALRNQQFRWNKGGAENFRKMARKIASANHPWFTKVHGIVHLLNSSVFLLAFLLGVLSIPALMLKIFSARFDMVFFLGSFFLLSTFFLMFFYWTSYRYRVGRGVRSFFNFFGQFVLFLSMSMALSLHNSVAVLEGLFGKKSSFIRTPKFNIQSKKDGWKANKYNKQPMSLLTFFEAVLMFYFLGGIVLALMNNEYGLVPFHLMLFMGFSMLFYYNFLQLRKA